MPNEEQCKRELLRAFDDGAQGNTVSAQAKAWLGTFCDTWLPNPSNADGQTVPEIWDQEFDGPPPNGRKFKGQFKRIGALAAAKSKAAGKDEITETDVETATQEVVESSTCPFCRSDT